MRQDMRQSTESPSKARRGHGRVTLAVVARAAGVTTMTVSRYLRGIDAVAQETGDRIEQALQSTGYTPNLQAGQLASGRSHVVAAIVPSIAHSIFADTLQGLGDGLQESGLQLLLAATNYSMAREEAHIRAVLGWGPAAIVVTGRRHTEAASALLRQAQQRGTPVIEMWDKPTQAEQPHSFVQIGFDHASVGSQMALHLIGRGWRELVYVDSGVAEDFRAQERGDGFMVTAQAQGVQARRIASPGTQPLAAGAAVLPLLGVRADQPAAVLGLAFANDQIAAGCVLAAQELGLQLPKQLGVLGFGDFPLSRHLAGGLSTVVVDGHAMGRACAACIAGQPSHRQDALPLSHPVVLRRETT
jgi:LacI family transcriptional regulator, gluconate utilization system Gnt-I transcriptional repressor